jgi:hypothetical protein
VRERDNRNSQLRTAILQTSDGANHSIVLRNLSQKGLGAKAQGRPPREGEEVVIQFEGREMVGRVRWVKGVLLASSFAMQLTPNIMP